MGRVFLAQDTLLGRTVAIKFIGAAEVSDHARERFYREARAIARLDHPNVVGIHRVGEFRQRPYLVSEYVEGESLDRIPKPVPWSRVVAIAIGTARGLAAAHRRDVLHRDIKPANIMLGGDDAAKLLDFGLASIVGAEDMKASAPQDLAVAATSPGDPAATTSAAGRVAPMKRDHVDEGEPLIGTPLYFAPELWHGQPASIASDIYAFGLVLYELLAGRLPGTGRSLGELRAAASEPVIDLESLVPGVPTALLQLVMSCVDRDPARRPATVDALLEQLELLRTPLGTDSPYRGLLAFQAEQRALFFGRNQDIGAIVDRLRRDSFVVVAGDSGVGKSSLCRAGVLPTFIDQEGSRWRVRVAWRAT